MEKTKYFVIGFRKIRTAEEYKNKVVGHNHRQRKYKENEHTNIDPTRTQNNIILQDLKYKNATELIEAGNSNRKGKARRLKKGSAFAFEVIVDCTPDENWTEQDYIRYLYWAVAYFKRRFKGQELISAVIHLDEGKPHLHLEFSYFNTELGRWNQRGLYEEELTNLNKILNDFKKRVGKKFGLERGKGKELDKPLKKELAKKAKEVKIKKGLFKSETKKVIFTKDAVSVIKDLNTKYKKAIYENEHLKQELIAAKNENKTLKEKLLQTENRVQELESENQTLKKETAKHKKAAEKFEKAVKRIKALEKELADWKQAAITEREKRLNTTIPENLREKTINAIKNDYGIQR